MQAFHCEPIRHHDAEGRLIAAGAAWNEKSHTIIQERVQSVAALILSLLFGTGFLMAGLSMQYWVLLAGPVIFYPMAAYAWHLVTRQAVERAMIFQVDDRTFTPLGTTSYPKVQEWTDAPPSRFLNIEVSPEGYRVDMLDDEGNIYNIASYLYREASIKVSIQLNKALEETRKAMLERKAGPVTL